MRESCSCGGGIQAWRKRDVIAWRTNHRHDDADQVEPQRQGAFTNSEIAPQYFMAEQPIEVRKIGFTIE